MAENPDSGRGKPPRPTIALPPRPSPDAALGPGASPGPMTMVSRFFSDCYSDPDYRSFSQLLAGAMQSPMRAAEGGGAGGEILGFGRNQAVDLVVAQPLIFAVPPGLSPSGMLNSPGLFSPQSPFGMSHQQALAQVTAQAALSQSHLHFESAHAPSSVTAPVDPSTDQPSSTKSSFTQSSDVPSSDTKPQQPTCLAVDKPANDGYNWRKYGQKQVKGSEYPRSYYKCTHLNCPVKKQVERSMDGRVSEIVYRGQHNHEQPPPNKRLKDGSDLNMATQAKKEPVLHGQIRYVNRSNETVSDRDQEPVPLSRSNNQEEVDSEMTMEDNYDDNNEPNPKRRNMDTGTGTFEVASSQKTAAEPKIIVQTRSEVDLLDDGYRWRKYGQKVVKGNPHPRSYYRCTYGGCNVRKHVERANADPKAVITTYEGKHNHDLPAAKTNSNNNGMQQSKAAIVTGNKKHTLVKEMDCGNAQRPQVLQLEEQVLV